MILCTECYIQQEGKTLMLYRNKIKNDISQGKWIGVGGKFENGESPEQCLIREVKEEAGVTLTEFKLRGIVTFVMLDGTSEPMYLFIYTASKFTGEIGECDEGTLKWIDTSKILDLKLWDGDRFLWDWILNNDKFFSACFKYNGNDLIEHQVAFY